MSVTISMTVIIIHDFDFRSVLQSISFFNHSIKLPKRFINPREILFTKTVFRKKISFKKIELNIINNSMKVDSYHQKHNI